MYLKPDGDWIFMQGIQRGFEAIGKMVHLKKLTVHLKDSLGCEKLIGLFNQQRTRPISQRWHTSGSYQKLLRAMKDASRNGGSLHGKGRCIVINIGKPIEEYQYGGHVNLEKAQSFKRFLTETFESFRKLSSAFDAKLFLDGMLCYSCEELVNSSVENAFEAGYQVEEKIGI